jgi:hypothetical protein
MTARSKAQTAIPGTEERIGDLLRMKAAAPIRAPRAQQDCDLGLFSDGHKQASLNLDQPKARS